MTEMQRQFEEWASTDCAWRAWQASRVATVVKLPLFCVDGVDAAEYRDDVVKALDEAGA